MPNRLCNRNTPVPPTDVGKEPGSATPAALLRAETFDADEIPLPPEVSNAEIRNETGQPVPDDPRTIRGQGPTNADT